MVKSCLEGPGAEALGLKRGPVLSHGFRLVVGGVNPLVGLNVALHCLSERGAFPPAALGADDEVHAGRVRLLGQGLDVDVLSGQQVECRGYARGGCGNAGSGDRPHRVDVFFESWRDRELGQRRDLRHDVVWLVRLGKPGIAL